MNDRELLFKKLNLTIQKVARLSGTCRETVRNWLKYKKLRMGHENLITDAVFKESQALIDNQRRLLNK
jgi:DNA-binding transcriptional regulator YiaG